MTFIWILDRTSDICEQTQEDEDQNCPGVRVWTEEKRVSSGAQAQLLKQTFTQVNEHVAHTVT